MKLLLVTSVLLRLLPSHFSHVQLCATPWTAAYQAPPSMGFFRQQYWSGVPLPSPNFSVRMFYFNIVGHFNTCLASKCDYVAWCVFFILNHILFFCCFFLSFRYTAKWFSYICIHFQVLFLFGLLQNIEQSSLCYTVGPLVICFKYGSVYLF